MRILFLILNAILLLAFFSCESENMEDKYYNQVSGENSGPADKNTSGKIVWLPLNGNLNDSLGNNVPIVIVGNTQFVDGINNEHGKGLYFDGNSYLLLSLGYYDTLSIVFWIKGDDEINPGNKPVLFDYGFNTLSAQLDGSTGATSLTVKKNNDSISSHESSSVEYLNSFYKYSFVYVEAGGDKTRVYFKGYSSSGDEIIYTSDYDFPGVINSGSELLYIGRSSLRKNQQNSYFKGAIDEIHIYNKTLSNAEVEAMALIPTK